MKAAIICPTPLLEVYAVTEDKYHLILAHLAVERGYYYNFYKNRCAKGDFVILDNSAHEFGVGRSITHLVELATEMKVSEVVLPDRLFFGDDTLLQAQEALPKIKKALPKVKIMAVPQGRTYDEFLTCLKGLLRLKVDTIGISKDYEVWPGGLAGVLAFIYLLSPKTQVHLLGWGRDLPALYELGKLTHLNIRGVDSAKPLVYALESFKLNGSPAGRQPEYPRRSENFFDRSGFKHTDLAGHNIKVFQHWAKGEIYIEPDEVKADEEV